MTEPLRNARPASGPLSDADREARIEQLLLAGLDQYFAGDYERAINIWTRVAFLERGHGRARAYIERARSALAEQQRESEELLHSGVAAYNAGDLDAARDLLTRSVDQGGPSDTALVFLQRLSRSTTVADPPPATQPAGVPVDRPEPGRPASTTNWTATLLASLVVVATILMVTRPLASWLSDLPVSGPPVQTASPEPLPVVRPSDLLIARAQELYEQRQLREALGVLEQIDIGDPRRGDADRLRAAVQRDLLSVARHARPAPAPSFRRTAPAGEAP